MRAKIRTHQQATRNKDNMDSLKKDERREREMKEKLEIQRYYDMSRKIYHNIFLT